jgi:hypothetical protein
MGIDPNWRTKELSREEVVGKYPDVPRLTILKIDVLRRGLHYTDRAYEAVDTNIHQVEPIELVKAERNQGRRVSPQGLTLKDGSFICQKESEISEHVFRDRYLLDVVDGKTALTDCGEAVAEVEFWEKPAFYDKATSNGTPMWLIASARPQRLQINPYPKCAFWNSQNYGSKYCCFFVSSGVGKNDLRDKKFFNDFSHSQNTLVVFVENILGDKKFFQDVTETVAEAIKQKGRYASYMMASGSVVSGNEIFDDEVDVYVKTLQAVGKAFKTEKFPVKLSGSAFNEKQLRKLYNSTGITTYTTNLEVLNEKLYNWICPGKAKFVRYNELKERLYKAVEIFGRGNVNACFVGGIETAQPYGFKSEDDALASTLKEADEIASHGVSLSDMVWKTGSKSIFYNQRTPSLEYFARLAMGLANIRRKYGLNIYTDDYRRCGNHPNTDLARID